MGTPEAEILEEFQKKASHMDFDFPAKEGTGIEKLIPHATPLARDLICKLLIYKCDERISARQALKHPYFRDLREQDKPVKKIASPPSLRTPEGDSAGGEDSKHGE